jgi:hypothetical protein
MGKEINNRNEKSEEISSENLPRDIVTSKGDGKAIKSASLKNKKNRKGGLSLFLSGALDETPKSTPPLVSSIY